MGAIQQAAQNRQIVSPAQSQIVNFIDDHGDAIQITSDDIRMRICPKANENEIAYFLELCRAQRLNPFLNEAYLVKFGSNPAQIMVAHKTLVKRAESHPQYDGMEHGVVVMREGRIYQEQRGAYYPEAGETLVGGWCKVYRKDRRMPIYAERSFKSMNKGQANWKSMPDVMIDKCAQAAALREAFPDDFASMYTREEMADVATSRTVPSTSEPVAPPQAPTGRIAQAKAESRPELTEQDLEWLKSASESLSERGFDTNEVKGYLWNLTKSEGITAAQNWYETQMQQYAPEPEVEGIEIADADIEFGEEQ